MGTAGGETAAALPKPATLTRAAAAASATFQFFMDSSFFSKKPLVENQHTRDPVGSIRREGDDQLLIRLLDRELALRLG